MVETQFGYHIIKLVDRKKAETVPLSIAKEKITDYLKAQKINATIADFVGEARKQGKVEVLLQ